MLVCYTTRSVFPNRGIFIPEPESNVYFATLPTHKARPFETFLFRNFFRWLNFTRSMYEQSIQLRILWWDKLHFESQNTIQNQNIGYTHTWTWNLESLVPRDWQLQGNEKCFKAAFPSYGYVARFERLAWFVFKSGSYYTEMQEAVQKRKAEIVGYTSCLILCKYMQLKTTLHPKISAKEVKDCNSKTMF